MIDAFHAHAPEYLEPVQRALDDATADLGFLRLDPAAWNGVADQSIDYAVMEKADNLSVVRFADHWSDLGGWDAIWREQQADAPAPRGAVTDPHSTAIDCDNVLLRSDHDDMEVVGIGLQNVMVVATNDAVLVADMSRAQDVKLAVSALKAKGARQAETFRRDHRPWGWFETLGMGERFQVKRIVVHPGAALSLQSHHHRSEHWVVVSGTARVTVDGHVSLVSENQSIYVPLGACTAWKTPERCRWS